MIAATATAPMNIQKAAPARKGPIPVMLIPRLVVGIYKMRPSRDLDAGPNSIADPSSAESIGSGEEHGRDAACDQQGCRANHPRRCALADEVAAVPAQDRPREQYQSLSPVHRLRGNEDEHRRGIGGGHQQRTRRIQALDVAALDESPQRRHHDADRSAEIAAVNSQHPLDRHYYGWTDAPAPTQPFSEL